MSQEYRSRFYKITLESRREFLVSLLDGMANIGFQGFKQDKKIRYRITSLDSGQVGYQKIEPVESITEKFSNSPEDYLVMYYILFKGVDYPVTVDLYIDNHFKESNHLNYSLTLSIPSSQIIFEPGNIKGFLNIFRNLCQFISPDYALADDEYSIDENIDLYKALTGKMGDFRLEKLLNNQLVDIYWVNYFGKKLVETFGEDRIRNAPFCNVEFLGTGGALLFQPLSARFENVNSYFDYKRKLAEYLGIDTLWKETLKQRKR